jgi:hypothetical protein
LRAGRSQNVFGRFRGCRTCRRGWCRRCRNGFFGRRRRRLGRRWCCGSRLARRRSRRRRFSSLPRLSPRRFQNIRRGELLRHLALSHNQIKCRPGKLPRQLNYEPADEFAGARTSSFCQTGRGVSLFCQTDSFARRASTTEMVLRASKCAHRARPKPGSLRGILSARAHTVYSEEQRPKRFPRTKKPAEDLILSGGKLRQRGGLRCRPSPVLLLPSKLFASRTSLRGVGGT